MNAREVIDAKGCYVSCGFIDSHLHVEGLHLLPEHYYRAFLAHGTTTVITDLHEIANAGGMAGVRWYLSLIDKRPPGSVCHGPFVCAVEHATRLGLGRIGVRELRRLKALDRVIGLGESDGPGGRHEAE